jgi:hypothetical protein
MRGYTRERITTANRDCPEGATLLAPHPGNEGRIHAAAQQQHIGTNFGSRPPQGGIQRINGAM